MKSPCEQMYTKKNNQNYYTNRHSCFLLQYHLVLVTKYRNPVLTGVIKTCVYSVIRSIFKERNLNILEINGEADYIHILFEADPSICPLELLNVVKTQSSRFVRKAYGDTLLKKWYCKPAFWSNSYFIATVSENSLSLVKEYIKNQGTDD